jgi:DNA-directed RNA polymerase subunit L
MEGRRSSKRALLKSANDAKKKVDEFLTKFEREVEKQKG